MVLLSAIHASGVRGLPQGFGPIEIRRRGLVVCGDNGSGKSSVVDALEYALAGTSTLFEVNRIGVDWERAAPHVRGDKMDISFTVTSEGINYQIAGPVRQENGLPNVVTLWTQTAKGAGYVLRRHMLLNFITSEPAQRGELLARFLDFRDFMQVDHHLQQALTRLEPTLLRISQEQINQTGAINTAFNSDFSAEQIGSEVLFPIIDAALIAAALPACATTGNVELSLAAVNESLGGEELPQRIQNLIELRRQIAQMPQIKTIADALDGLLSVQHNYESIVAAATELELTNILTRAKDFIEGDKPSICPICEKPIDDLGVLSTRLSERIASSEALLDLKERVDLTVSTAKKEISKHLETAGKVVTQWVDEDLPRPQPELIAFKAIMGRVDECLAKLDLDFEALGSLRNELQNLAFDSHFLVEKVDSAIRSGIGEERMSALLDIKRMLISLQRDLPAFGASGSQLNIYRERKRVYERLRQHATDARKETVREILNEVADLANRYYQFIHLGEPPANSRLSVREVARASIMISSEFDGRQESPQLHYSESHLDTLGLCYFLALRRRESNIKPFFRLLILDDIIHSVDAAHRRRICDLLHDEFGDHQLVITTHDPLFYQMLREVLGGPDIMSYYRITHWAIDRGPILLGQESTNIDAIATHEARTARSPEDIANIAGRILEAISIRLAERLRVSVLMRYETNYTLADTWPPLAKQLRAQHGFAIIGRTVVEQLEANRWVRNACAAHYNETPTPPSAAECLAFAEMTYQLYTLTHCNACGRYIGVNNLNANWHCQCERIIYLRHAPAVEPVPATKTTEARREAR